jgi:hypothetical protein
MIQRAKELETLSEPSADGRRYLRLRDMYSKQKRHAEACRREPAKADSVLTAQATCPFLHTNPR